LNVIGLISGTSMDAIDAALIELERVDDRLCLFPLAFTMAPIEPAFWSGPYQPTACPR